MAICAALLAGLAGAASASTRLRLGGSMAGGVQLAQVERYRPRGPSNYNKGGERRRRFRRRGYDDDDRGRSNRGNRYRSPPGSLNYGRGNNGVLPMGEVVPNVRRAVPGQVLRGGLQGSRYWFRVLTNDGRVVDVYADARTGRILGVRGAR